MDFEVILEVLVPFGILIVLILLLSFFKGRGKK